MEKATWNKPELKKLGTVGSLVLGGGGKLSSISGDPGEPRKPTGSGGG